MIVFYGRAGLKTGDSLDGHDLTNKTFLSRELSPAGRRGSQRDLRNKEDLT